MIISIEEAKNDFLENIEFYISNKIMWKNQKIWYDDFLNPIHPLATICDPLNYTLETSLFKTYCSRMLNCNLTELENLIIWMEGQII